MAEKLSIEIGLEGGEEIQRQLKEMGKAGQQAFLDISKAAEQVGGFAKLKPEDVTAKFKEMGITSVAEINKINAALQSAIRTEQLIGAISKIENGFSSLRTTVQVVGATIAGVFTPTLIKQAASALINLSEAVTKVDAQAIKLGKSFVEFDKLRQGFINIGISAKDAGEAIAKFDLSNVERAARILEEASKRGFGGFGTQEMAILEQAAKRLGPAGDLARKTLEGLGQSVEDLESKLGKPAQTIGEFIARLSRMPDSADRTRLAISRLGEATGIGLIQALRAGGPVLAQFRQDVAGALTQDDINRANAMTEAINRLGGAWDRLRNIAGTMGPLSQDIADLTAAINFLNQQLDSSGGKWTNWFAVASQALLGAIKWVGDLLARWNELATAAAGDLWSSFKNAGVAAWNAITDAINKAIDAVLKFLGLRPSGGAASGAPAPGMAGGGLIGGRGSGTSDSNLAWVSRGEFITPASAVRQPGVLAFLEALRRSGGDLRHLLNGMGRFALGGPVGMPALARGGLGGMHPVTIQFPGLAPIGGLRASADVVNELQRAAALAQVRSGGRKPSRYT